MNDKKARMKIEKVEKDWKYMLENKAEQKKFEFYNGMMVFH